MSASPGRVFGLLLAVASVALLLAAPADPAEATPSVLVVEFDNDVNPVTQDFLQDEMHRAEEDGRAAVVIEMDTPGGLGSMREIVKTMLALKIPVVVFVAPPGSSADCRRRDQAADILAMAPQTNIGSSTPISATGDDLGEDLRKKVINDAARTSRSSPANTGETPTPRRRWCATPRTTARGRRSSSA